MAPAQLPPHSDNGNVVSQVVPFNRWLAETRSVRRQLDLTRCRDPLLQSLAPARVRAQVSSIRRSNMAPIEYPRRCAAFVELTQGQSATADFAASKAMADGLEPRL